ncbi:hypothetical protein H0A61_01251 [Koleobacter methoxysyntrophicus]|uniref:Lipoprotein n=1 Tax=Koleobacter methoxysyntrophicus TaxID=2751313 RepID=A0A8A0RMR9_9FIRM|nr:hypothetical protein H0A61_01251 [Koleobacter methoxysyntrophicus]
MKISHIISVRFFLVSSSCFADLSVTKNVTSRSFSVKHNADFRLLIGLQNIFFSLIAIINATFHEKHDDIGYSSLIKPNNNSY